MKTPKYDYCYPQIYFPVYQTLLTYIATISIFCILPKRIILPKWNYRFFPEQEDLPLSEVFAKTGSWNELLHPLEIPRPKTRTPFS